jgi:hypothetical protein
MHELDVLQLPEAGQGHEFDGLVENTWLDEDRRDSLQDIPVKAPRHRDIAADLDERFIIQTKRVRKPSAKVAAVAININTILLIVACVRSSPY